jgi:phage tail sheath protein FI
VQAAIDNYLYLIWQQGALAGNKAEEAYFVRVGKSITMTQDDINQGKMIIQVGMAAVRPAEFIILKFTQDMSQ